MACTLLACRLSVTSSLCLCTRVECAASEVDPCQCIKAAGNRRAAQKTRERTIGGLAEPCITSTAVSGSEKCLLLHRRHWLANHLDDERNIRACLHSMMQKSEITIQAAGVHLVSSDTGTQLDGSPGGLPAHWGGGRAGGPPPRPPRAGV